MDTPEARENLKRIFPKLNSNEFAIKSCQTNEYNCISFAAGCDWVPWDPFNEPDTYWPIEAPQDFRVESLVLAYRSEGYLECESPELEPGLEKIAIYCLGNGEYAHAALQLEDGRWKSKCGELEDIEHDKLEALEMPDYGIPKKFLARPRTVIDDRTQPSQQAQREGIQSEPLTTDEALLRAMQIPPPPKAAEKKFPPKAECKTGRKSTKGALFRSRVESSLL